MSAHAHGARDQRFRFLLFWYYYTESVRSGPPLMYSLSTKLRLSLLIYEYMWVFF